MANKVCRLGHLNPAPRGSSWRQSGLEPDLFIVHDLVRKYVEPRVILDGESPLQSLLSRF